VRSSHIGLGEADAFKEIRPAVPQQTSSQIFKCLLDVVKQKTKGHYIALQ